jgi:hypothetical protein
MPNPSVSVVVSTYGSEALIGGCLEMLLEQTIAPQLEIIVIDSGSPQREGDVVRQLQRRHESIRYVRTERETLYQAWNRGLELANGTYFANVNTDDWIRDDALELMVSALDHHSECDLAYAHWAVTDTPRRAPVSDDLVCWHPTYEPALPLVFCFGGCVQFWRASSLRSLGGFDPSFVACGDLEVLCRLADTGGSAVLVPEVLEGFFRNPDGISQRNDVPIAEQRAIFADARRNVDIHRLYATSPDDVRSVADAWTALGNVAMTASVPWLPEPLLDHTWALECYTRALEVVPLHIGALHNRHVVLRSIGRAEEAEQHLRALPAPVRVEARSSHFGLMAPAISPAVRGPIFDVPTAARRSTHLVGRLVAGPRRAEEELADAKAYIESLEQHLHSEREGARQHIESLLEAQQGQMAESPSRSQLVP